MKKKTSSIDIIRILIIFLLPYFLTGSFGIFSTDIYSFEYVGRIFCTCYALHIWKELIKDE